MDHQDELPIADWEGALRRLGPPPSRFRVSRIVVGLSVFAVGSLIGYLAGHQINGPRHTVERSGGTVAVASTESSRKVLADERLADPRLLRPSRSGATARIALPKQPGLEDPPDLTQRLAARAVVGEEDDGRIPRLLRPAEGPTAIPDLIARLDMARRPEQEIATVVQPVAAKAAEVIVAAAPVTLPAVKPAIVPDGTPAWRRFAVAPPALSGGKPAIAIVMDDLGVDKARTRRAIALPGPLTTAWLPYATKLEAQVEAARRAGHELMVHMPMEPLTRASDPGPNALLVGLSRGELERRLLWNLSRFDGFVGVNNHMGSRFTSHHGVMGVVARELKRRGLLFLDSRTVETSVALEVATAEGVPSTTRDVFIDHSQQPEMIAQQLRMVERIARRTGHAIAIAHPHDVTLKALRRWLPSLAKRGFALVPLSAIVVDKFGDPAPQLAGKPKAETDTPG